MEVVQTAVSPSDIKKLDGINVIMSTLFYFHMSLTVTCQEDYLSLHPI